jgi:hypothetical protein
VLLARGAYLFEMISINSYERFLPYNELEVRLLYKPFMAV